MLKIQTAQDGSRDPTSGKSTKVISSYFLAGEPEANHPQDNFKNCCGYIIRTVAVFCCLTETVITLSASHLRTRKTSSFHSQLSRKYPAAHTKSLLHARMLPLNSQQTPPPT